MSDELDNQIGKNGSISGSPKKNMTEEHDNEPSGVFKDAKKEKEHVFKIGDVVKIKRELGQIEEGWEIESIDEKGGAIVKKTNGKDTASIAVSLEELKEWNAGGQKEQPEARPEVDPKKIEEEEKARSERRRKINEAMQEVAKARKEYLEVEYKKNTALKRIRKFFVPGSVFSEDAKENRINIEQKWNKKGPDDIAQANPDDFAFGMYEGGNYIGRDKYEHKKRMKSYESDMEIAAYKAYYDNALLNLQELLIEDAKEDAKKREISDVELDKKLAELYTVFEKEANITLVDEHNDVKAEQQFGTIPEIGKGLEQLIKKYQNLPTGLKVGLGVVLMAGGGGLAFAGIPGIALGTTAGSIFAGTLAFKRFAGGIMAGVGLKMSLDAKDEKADRKDVENKERVFKIDMRRYISPEDKYDFLIENIRKKVINYDKYKIDNIKNRRIKNLAIGTVVAGIIAGLGPALKGFHKVAEHFGLSYSGEGALENMKERSRDIAERLGLFSGTANAAENITGSNSTGIIGSEHAVGNSEVHETVAQNVSVAETVNPVYPVETLKIMGSGGNDWYEKAFQRYFDNPQKLKEFMALHPEYEGVSIPRIVDEITLKFVEEHEGIMQGHMPDLVHEGTDITFDPKTMRTEIYDPSPKGFGWYTHDASGKIGYHFVGNSSSLPDGGSAGAVEIPDGSVQKEFPVNFELPDSKISADISMDGVEDAITGQSIASKEAPSSTVGIEDAANTADSKVKKAAVKAGLVGVPLAMGAVGTKKILEGIDKQKETGEKEKSEAEEKKEKNKRKNELEELLDQRSDTSRILRYSLERLTSGSTRKAILWKKIKDMPFDLDLLFPRGVNKRVKRGMENTIKEFQAIIGKEALPRKKTDGKIETVREWLARVVKESIGNNKLK